MSDHTVVKDESSRQRWLVVNRQGAIVGSARTRKAAQEIADTHAMLTDQSERVAKTYPRWPY